jgi:LPS export ABC transporter protein LptC
MRPLLFALPILVALGVLLATWQGPAPAPQRAAPSAQSLPRYKVLDGQWTRYNAKGQPEFVVTAQSIEYYDDESARLTTLEMHSLGGANSPWRLSAPEGYAPPQSQHRMQLRGGVDAMGHWPEGEPLHFTAPYLWVDERNRQLFTDAAVEVRGRNRSATADGLRADWVGKSIELLGHTKMRYAPPPG